MTTLHSAQSLTTNATTNDRDDAMKKMIGAAIANWLRKPENREKAKRTAKQAYAKYQRRKGNSTPEAGPKSR
ncbi:MAG: hypothetical protein CMN25_04360 [Salinicola sp.]|nr:hypothetical protein [Salinicola sp.]|tara:strand:- start:15 stop:230 length:216 start_codon:yes stop_codon:yes gene_type:complete